MSEPYNIIFRRADIDFEKYTEACKIVRQKYPFVKIMRLRALIFEEGINSFLKCAKHKKKK